MAIAIVALLAFGGSYAYFTAEASAKESGNITSAVISLKAGETVTLDGHTGALLPEEKVTATITYTDSSTRGTWIVVSATADTASIGAGASVELSDMTSEAGVTITKYTKTGSPTLFVIENSKTDATNGDVVSAASIPLSCEATYDATENNVDGKEAAALTNMGKTFKITFTAKSIQHQGYTAATALTTLGYDGYTAA